MWRPLLAEAVGAFLLVALGCGAILVHEVAPLGVPLAFGLAVGLGVALLAPVSQAHFNPAVSVALAVAGRFPWRSVAPYIGAQSLGATSAAWLLVQTLRMPIAPARVQSLPGLSTVAAIAVEALLTSVLMLTILAVVHDRRVSPRGAGAAIGAAVTLGALVGGPLTGGSMNPARTLAPALVDGALHDLVPGLVGPLVGAVLAVFVFLAVVRPVPAATDDGAAMPVQEVTT